MDHLRDYFTSEARGRPPSGDARCLACGGPTRESKPYCPAHVLLGDYAQQVSSTNDRLRAEIEGLESGTLSPSVDLLLAESLMLSLLDTPDLGEVARTLGLSAGVLHKLARKLAAAGRIELYRARKRGLPYARRVDAA